MKRISIIAAVAGAALSIFSAQGQEEPPVTLADLPKLAENGFTNLLSDELLDDFTVKGGSADFIVQQGMLIGKGKGLKKNSFFSTNKSYQDFIFAFEFKFDDFKGNSGCMFRAQQKPEDDSKDPGRVFGYQCEHDNNAGRSWTGGLYDEGRRKWLFPYREDRKGVVKDPANKAAQKLFTAQGRRLFKRDGWNLFVIQCRGDRVQTWLNGEVRVDFIEPDKEIAKQSGFFGFQVHSGKECNVRWRNIFVKEL